MNTWTIANHLRSTSLHAGEKFFKEGRLLHGGVSFLISFGSLSFLFIRNPQGTASTQKKGKKRKNPYVRKTDKMDLMPLQKIPWCRNDTAQHNLEDEHLQALRDEYKKCITNQEKREFLEQFVDAERKKFCIHGNFLSWRAFRALFGCSYTLMQTVLKTDQADFKDATRINQVSRC